MALANQAVITGRRPFFYWYDVNSGKVQKVPRVFSSGRVEKRMETFAASPDGRWLAFLGSGGGFSLRVGIFTSQPPPLSLPFFYMSVVRGSEVQLVLRDSTFSVVEEF